ncbi:MAG: DoxX family membrane protein [Proteobacteria bacterium]|nr:MAG: DoxX family membrane protein [Pseudomonadota bacterium]
MLVAFVESIKYVGHLLPVAFLRVFLGYYYFNQALIQLHGDFLTHAYLAEDVRNFLPRSTAPDWYKHFLEVIVIPNWQIFAWAIVVIHLVIGLSYILGYLVRPMSVIAVLLGFNLMMALGTQQYELQTTFVLVIHFTLGWLGAGRCLGLDYYFYKRRRGIWW